MESHLALRQVLADDCHSAWAILKVDRRSTSSVRHPKWCQPIGGTYRSAVLAPPTAGSGRMVRFQRISSGSPITWVTVVEGVRLGPGGFTTSLGGAAGGGDGSPYVGPVVVARCEDG
jgi:hypothetical protein